MIPAKPSRFQRSRSSKRRHQLRAGICPSNRRSRCHFFAVLVTLLAMLAAFLLLPIVTVFVVIDHDSTSEESTSIASGFGPEVRVENTYGSGGAGNGSVSMSGSGSDLGSTVVVETDNRVGDVGKLSNGWDRCFVDEDGYHRCYPMVFFFGTSKCATTSLARWLDEHPVTHWVANPRRPHQIEETGVKEAHVFDDPPKGNRNQEQIILHQKLLITSPKVSRDDVVIDYTPHYMASSEAVHRIYDMYGKDSGLKFIVTLREPASRAISSWEFKNEYNPKKGRREETRTLRKTVKDGIKRGTKLLTCVKLAKENNLGNRERDLLLCNPRKFLEMPLYVSHVGKSMYAVQLERWFNLFGRENVKVIFMDDMATDPIGVLEDVLDFLGLDFTNEDESKGLPDFNRWEKITRMSYNKTKSKKKDELANQVTDELKAELRQFFEPQNRELEKLLGCPVPPAWNE